MDAVSKRLPPKGMEVKPRDVHLHQGRCVMQDVKPSTTSRDQIRSDLRGPSFFEDLLQALVAEALDHEDMCNS